MAKSRDSDIAHEIVRDTRYEGMTAHDLKVMRSNMIERSDHTKYELACVQYWIMSKENRLNGMKHP